MKTHLFILLVFLSINPIITFSQLQSSKALVGKWVGIDKQKAGTFEFFDSEHIKLTYPNGIIINCTYTIDFTKSPFFFDIINSRFGQTKILKGLIKIIDDTTFKWYTSVDGKRSVDYSAHSVTFHKNKPTL